MASSSWYRRNYLQFKGNREYTKAGYETASQHFNEKDLDVDCSDKHYMITGANSGLGLTTALEIAKRGGILHLVCRNAKAMKEARSLIITTTGNDRISQHLVNLAKPREVIKWAEEFVKKNKQLDVLINNAGTMIRERNEDLDGIESNFAVNSLAVHIIISTLQPLIEKSEDGRVIIVSSCGMLTVKVDPTDLNFEKMKPFDAEVAYAQCKRQQVVMNFHYAQKYSKIFFSSMHPGWVDTPLLAKNFPEFFKKMETMLRTPLQGADTIIWLAISEAAKKCGSGLFFQDRQPVPTHVPMAWTKTTIEIEQQLVQKLDEILDKFSNLEDYFKIGNIGSDILATDSFLGNDSNKLSESMQSHILATQVNTSHRKARNSASESSDIVSTQTSLDHPARRASTLNTEEDDEIISAVENILYNDNQPYIFETNNNPTNKSLYHEDTKSSQTKILSNSNSPELIVPQQDGMTELPLADDCLHKAVGQLVNDHNGKEAMVFPQKLDNNSQIKSETKDVPCSNSLDSSDFDSVPLQQLMEEHESETLTPFFASFDYFS